MSISCIATFEVAQVLVTRCFVAWEVGAEQSQPRTCILRACSGACMHLEDAARIRRVLEQRCGNYDCTCLCVQRYASGSLQIPTHYYSVVTSCLDYAQAVDGCDGPLSAFAFILPHRPDNDETCNVSPSQRRCPAGTHICPHARDFYLTLTHLAWRSRDWWLIEWAASMTTQRDVSVGVSQYDRKKLNVILEKLYQKKVKN